MQKIPITLAQPRMVIASTVRDNNGDIIFMRGVELTERHIAMLDNRNIKEIVVEGEPVQQEKAKDESLSKEIDRRFGTAGPHPAVLKIRSIVKELLA
ncbi:MAG: hypothetical protein AB1805_09595 [Nitrospirota bacterium]